MLGRWFGGVFGAAPYAIAGGSFHDMLDPLHVQIGIAFFAVATAGGPALGPVVGAGLVSTSDEGWRWVGWYVSNTNRAQRSRPRLIRSGSFSSSVSPPLSFSSSSLRSPTHPSSSSAALARSA
jgi:MFS family permease